MRYLNPEELDRALPMTACLAALEEAFGEPDSFVLPERVFMPQPRPGREVDAWLGAMPAGWIGHGFGAKLVSLVTDNPAEGRPGIQGVALLMHPETGVPLLLTDAALLTTRRTAALAGLATRYLAPADASRLAVIGTGALTADMIAAMRAVRPIESIRLFNRTPDKAAAVATWHAGAEVATTAAEAVDGVDIVITCTTSRTPVVPDAALGNHVHVNAVGNYSADGTELELGTVARSNLFVDTYEGASTEAGEVIQAGHAGLIDVDSAILGDLSELVTGTARPPQRDRPTLFKSVGTAMADIAALVAANEAAERADLGTTLA